MKQALLWIDQFWCKSSLVSAQSLYGLSTSDQNPLKLAALRVLSIFTLFFELLGVFLLVRGAVMHDAKIFAFGAAVKILGYLASGVLHNKSGIYLQLWWGRYLTVIRQYQKEFSGILNQLGFTNQDIQSILLLPQELYNAELASYPYSRLLGLLTPLTCSMVLLLEQQYIPALLIAGIGIIAIHLGRHFFIEFNFRQQREQRLIISAKSYENLSNSTDKHLLLTLRVNAISQLPLILFSLMPFIGIERALFANYLAFTMGLSGLTGLLAYQKSRVASEHSVRKAYQLLNALSSDVFLLSECQLNKHSQNQLEKAVHVVEIPFNDGIIIDRLISKAFLNSHHPFQPFSASISKGSYHILQAPSGYGKSLLILSLLHLIDHDGEVLFISDGNITNIHALSRLECSQTLVFFRVEDLPVSARLVDIFSKILQTYLEDLYSNCEAQFGPLPSELAWNTEDILLEREIQLFNQEGRSIFPKAMISTLIQIRHERNRVLTSWLKDVFQNDSQVQADRVFCTLSAGEQRRIVNLLTLKTAFRSDDAKLVIFDEPLSNLDEENIERQLQMFAEFQQNKKTPLLIVTHHHIQAIEKHLGSSCYLNF